MAPMKSYAKKIGLFFVLVLLTGCASTNVTQQTPMTAAGLARPNQIWVYDSWPRLPICLPIRHWLDSSVRLVRRPRPRRLKLAVSTAQ